MMWESTEYDDGFHVIPLNDKEPHLPTVGCKCNPRVESVEGATQLLIVHHSYDQREMFEEHITIN